MNVYTFNTNGGTLSGPSFNLLINDKKINSEDITPQTVLPLVSLYIKATTDGLTLPVTGMNVLHDSSQIQTDITLLNTIRKTQPNGDVLKAYEYLYQRSDYLRWLNNIVPKSPENLQKIYKTFEQIYDDLNPLYRINKDGNLNRIWQ